MKKAVFAVTLAVLLAGLQAVAQGYEVRGTVREVNPEANKLTISFDDPYSGDEKTRDILVKPDTIYNGIVNFAGLQPGQPILVDVEEDQAHGWVASAVKTDLS